MRVLLSFSLETECGDFVERLQQQQDLTCLIRDQDPPRELIPHPSAPPDHQSSPRPDLPPSRSSPALMADRCVRVDVCVRLRCVRGVQLCPGPPPLHAARVRTRKTDALRSVNYKRRDFLKRNWRLSQSTSREGSTGARVGRRGQRGHRGRQREAEVQRPEHRGRQRETEGDRGPETDEDQASKTSSSPIRTS